MKLLIVANIYSHHITSIIQVLKEQSPDLCFDIFNTNFLTYNRGVNIPRKDLYSQIYNAKRRWPSILYKFPFIRGKLALHDLIYSFRRLNGHYNSVTFHQVPLFASDICDMFHKLSHNVIVHPFGSEVLRVSLKRQKKLTSFFQKIDYCATIGPQMKGVLFNKYGLDKSIVNIGYGSTIIDLINKSNYSKDSAKNETGLEGKYVIACGYNGYRGQNQLEIILQISKVIDFLPDNYIIVVPMTYGASKNYINKIEKVLKVNRLKYKLFLDFMSEENVVLLRKATDIFINAQPTDNMAGSVLEFLLCGAKMLNWSKIRYYNLEEFGIPYFIYDNLNSIGETLLLAINSDPLMTDELLFYIKNLGRENQMKLWSDFYHSLS